MAGIDRSKLSKEEVAYLDGLETQVSGGNVDTELEKAYAGLPEGVKQRLIKRDQQFEKMQRDSEVQEDVIKVAPLTALPIVPKDFGETLYKVRKGQAGQTEYDEILAALSSADAVAKMGSNIMESAGVTKTADGNSAGERLQRMAKLVMAEEGVEYEVAMGKVASNPANRDLMEEYREEQVS